MMYTMAIDMDLDLIGRPGIAGEAMRQMNPRMPMYMPMANFGPLFAMWAIMMAAMMLPTIVPSLRTYEDLISAADGTWAGWIGVLTGYAIMWIAFAAFITIVQLGLLFGGVVDMLGIAKSPLVGAGLLIVVGAFQFTRTKDICHGVCHSPMSYFLGRWRTGALGGLRMGLGLGAYCVICCWGFMALGFVGGVMNLAWMGLATLFMVLEKLPQIGHRVVRPLGILMIIGGVVLAMFPLWSGG
ncbi:MAG: DUF2182 domain-containing protein [Roseovarius sp.]|nr:DUF2182 domain-containing protein [Roseovarius sp.]